MPVADLIRTLAQLDLDLDRLGALARLVRDSVRTARLLFRFEPAAVRTMLVGVVADGRAEVWALAPTLREQL